MLYHHVTSLVMAAAMVSFCGCCCTHSSLCGPGPGYGDCKAAACDPVGGCAHGWCGHKPVLNCAEKALTCGSGCGEIYWDEWCNDPPACCDPCDGYGHWTGDAWCSPFHPLRGLGHLWGYRFASAGCGDCGACDAYAPIGDTLLPVEPKPPEKVQEQLPAPKPETEAARYPNGNRFGTPRYLNASASYRPARRIQ